MRSLPDAIEWKSSSPLNLPFTLYVPANTDSVSKDVNSRSRARICLPM